MAPRRSAFDVKSSLSKGWMANWLISKPIVINVKLIVINVNLSEAAEPLVVIMSVPFLQHTFSRRPLWNSRTVTREEEEGNEGLAVK